MDPRLQRILLSIVASIILVDSVWASLVHFDLDRSGYLAIGVLSGALAGGGIFYDRVRKDVGLSAMLLAAGFLIAFSAAFSVFNYFLLSVPGVRIDDLLARIDGAMGFDWPSMMAFISRHPGFNFLLKIAYQTMLPQTALLVICLGWKKRCDELSGFCLAVAIAAAVTVLFWAFYPSFGAFAIFHLDPSVTSHIDTALDTHYAQELLRLAATGPGHIAPGGVKGLIGFPSFHTAMAVMIAWYARRLPYIRWPAAALNLLVVISTPIQGGHHVVDIFGGFAVTAMAVVLSDRILAAATAARPRVAQRAVVDATA
jgi:hypothetical protein